MRELNAGTLKVRRSSFSNTLSGLPEVEEPYSEMTSPIPAILEERKSSISPQLPPIIDVAAMGPEPRLRIHSLPSVSKTKFHFGNITKTAIKTCHMDRQVPHENGPRVAKPTIYQTDCKSKPYYLANGRRWSIGSPVSRVTPTSTSTERRLRTKENVERKTVRNYSNNREPHEGISTQETLSNESTLSSNRVKSPRKFSEPSLVLDDKDRLEILRDPIMNRRWSNPAFAETAKKVNTVLRLGRNMRNKLYPSDMKPDQNRTFRTLADLAVEMPKCPRFSAMMSPEAQYSIMMGYEDKIYDRLIKQRPEYETVLKRNKTPVKKVHIRRKNSIGFIDDDEDDDDDSGEEVSENHNSTPGSFLTQPTEDASDLSFDGLNSLSPRHRQDHGSTNSLDSSTTERPDSRSTLRSLRRLSVSLEKKHYLDRFFDKVNDDNDDNNTMISYVNLQRSYSLPDVSCLPFTRRLMMTHRLESAMDILDAMKTEGEHYLSPRMKARKSVPFVDYTSWVHEWNKEFRTEHGKS